MVFPCIHLCVFVWCCSLARRHERGRHVHGTGRRFRWFQHGLCLVPPLSVLCRVDVWLCWSMSSMSDLKLLLQTYLFA